MTLIPEESVQEYPLLPLRDVVVFPHMVVPLFVGREKSIQALEAAMEGNKEILLVAQRDASTDEPGPDDVFAMGTVATVLQMLRLPDGTVKVWLRATPVQPLPASLKASISPVRPC